MKSKDIIKIVVIVAIVVLVIFILNSYFGYTHTVTQISSSAPPNAFFFRL